MTAPGIANRGKIIRTDTLRRSVWASPVRVVRRDVDIARLQARQIVEAAQAEARSIREEAENKRAEVLKAAVEKGYEEGLRRWNQILATATTRSEELVKRNEEDLMRLAVRMAEKIIGEQLNSDPATMVRIVGEALKSVRREKSLTIQVHPDCVELIRGRISELKARAGGTREIWVEPNAAVKPGGCIVESDVGVIDAR
ncbi:MAG TPA: type III secretion system stator protein SctL, partial [bacterium]|nr:type III secretion system stator protein SctL [bacterium]